jgi:ADP-heptose:LPS heptosyltransferase
VRRDLLFFKLAGIKRVIGVRGIEPLPAKNEASLPHVIHELDHLLDRLAQDGINVPARGTASIDLGLSDAEHRRAQSWLESNADAIHERTLVGFGPGSKWPSKIWPEERYLETGARLIERHDICPIVFGGADDRAAGERLISGWRRGVNAAGKLPVREAASVLKSCQLYVGNDTGTMHLAAAMGTPCVVVMAALDWPGHWNPYGRGHVVLRRVVPCEGCLLQVCQHQAMRCLTEISVDDVFNASQKILEARAPDMTQQSFRVSSSDSL